MALKEYAYQGRTYQFEESEAPEGAVELLPRNAKASQAPADKAARRPTNKARTARAKKEG